MQKKINEKQADKEIKYKNLATATRGRVSQLKINQNKFHLFIINRFQLR